MEQTRELFFGFEKRILKKIFTEHHKSLKGDEFTFTYHFDIDQKLLDFIGILYDPPKVSTFREEYIDDASYSLALQDIWIKKRNETIQLKQCVPSKDDTYMYQKLEDRGQIDDILSKHNLSVETLNNKVATFDIQRYEYTKDSHTLFVDVTYIDLLGCYRVIGRFSSRDPLDWWGHKRLGGTPEVLRHFRLRPVESNIMYYTKFKVPKLYSLLWFSGTIPRSPHFFESQCWQFNPLEKKGYYGTSAPPVHPSNIAFLEEARNRPHIEQERIDRIRIKAQEREKSQLAQLLDRSLT